MQQKVEKLKQGKLTPNDLLKTLSLQETKLNSSFVSLKNKTHQSSNPITKKPKTTEESRVLTDANQLPNK